MFPDKIHLTVILVQKKIEAETKKGLCSDYFERIYKTNYKNSQISVRAFIKSSVFNMPENPMTPVINIKHLY